MPRAVIELVPFRETLLVSLMLIGRFFFFFLLVSQFVYLAMLLAISVGQKQTERTAEKPANGRGQVQGFTLASSGNAVRLRLPLRLHSKQMAIESD